MDAPGVSQIKARRAGGRHAQPEARYAVGRLWRELAQGRRCPRCLFHLRVGSRPVLFQSSPVPGHSSGRVPSLACPSRFRYQLGGLVFWGQLLQRAALERQCTQPGTPAQDSHTFHLPWWFLWILLPLPGAVWAGLLQLRSSGRCFHVF